MGGVSAASEASAAPKGAVDVTIVVNAHREGLLAVPSYRSAARARARAEAEGLAVETLSVLDCADDLTAEVAAAALGAGDRLLRVAFGDLGRARNAAVVEAAGRWIAFLDADDLWCEDWLTRALASARADARAVIWHPEVNLYFGGRLGLWRHIDMEADEFEWESLLLDNYWTALSFVPREVARAYPYPPTDLLNQIGYEDWGWNVATIGGGVLHKIVPGTCHGVRVKNSSLLARTNASNAVIRPSPAFLERMLTSRRRARER